MYILCEMAAQKGDVDVVVGVWWRGPRFAHPSVRTLVAPGPLETCPYMDMRNSALTLPTLEVCYTGPRVTDDGALCYPPLALQISQHNVTRRAPRAARAPREQSRSQVVGRFASLQHLRSYQDGYRLVTVYIRGAQH